MPAHESSFLPSSNFRAIALAVGILMLCISEAQVIRWLIGHPDHKTFQAVFNLAYVPFLVLFPSVIFGSAWSATRKLANREEVSQCAERLLLKNLGLALAYTYLAMSCVLGVVCR